MTAPNRYTNPLTGNPGHFADEEFMNRDRLLAPPPILSLEQVRADAWDWEEKRQRKARGFQFALLGMTGLDEDGQLSDSIRAASEVAIVISEFGGVRTDKDNAKLAKRLGWIGEVWNPYTKAWQTRIETQGVSLGEVNAWPRGTVSRTSQHLPSQGATAVDILKAYVISSKEVVPQRVLGDICRKRFVYVKDSYRDGHVHADNRDGGLDDVVVERI